MKRRLGPAVAGVAAVCAASLFAGVPAAGAAPASDSRGFVDSTARCAAPDSAAVFGRTATSRVAVCKRSGGGYEYRGVRVRDGAKLITAATAAGTEYIAENDGVTYTVTPDSLVVAVGKRVIRDEPMVEFAKSDASVSAAAPVGPTSPTPTTPLPPPLPAEVGGAS